jgi:hypothetical protein
MDIIKAYTFIPSEESWITKLLIGAVIVFFSWLFIPIFFLTGYQIAVARNVKDGHKEVMPSWTEDLGQTFMDGVVVWLAQLVYSLPLVLMMICVALLIIPAAMSADEFDIGAVAGGAVAGSIALICIALVYAVFLALILPAVVIQYVRTEELGSMFSFREVFGIVRDNVVDILLTLISAIAAGFVFSLLNVIPICGQLFVAFVVPVWMQISVGHLLGQIAAKIDGKTMEMEYAV